MKMKITITIIFLCLLSPTLSAQLNIYNALVKRLNESHPEINLENKVIAYNIWSIENSESRKANLAFDKAFRVYEYAKLKGGVKGFIAVAINTTGANSDANIVFSKDGNIKLISLAIDDFINLKSTNAVFDSKGNQILSDLKSDEIFDSINKLITR